MKKWIWLCTVVFATGCNLDGLDDENRQGEGEGEGEGETPAVGEWPSTTALLEGDALGSGAVPVADLRRQIDVVVLDEGSGAFDVSVAYVVRPAADALFYSWVAVLHNATTEARCPLGANAFELRDDSGAVLHSAPGLVAGFGLNAQYFETGTYVISCLGPNERGILFAQVADSQVSYSDVAVIALTLSGQAEQNLFVAESATRVAPESYQINAQSLSISVRNTGALAADVPPWLFAVLLDDAEQPLFVTLVGDVGAASAPLAPGANRTIGPTALSYLGSSTRLVPFLAFSVP